jgi:hypothetical protein
MKRLGPAVFTLEFSQGRENSRVGVHRESIERHDLHELAADLRNHASPHLLPTHQAVDVHRDGRKLHRVVATGAAELEPPQEVFLRGDTTVLRSELMPLQALQLHRRRESRFDVRDVSLKRGKQSLRGRELVRRGLLVVEHEFDKLSLREGRRKEGEGDNEIAFVHRVHLLEEPSAFLVDG